MRRIGGRWGTRWQPGALACAALLASASAAAQPEPEPAEPAEIEDESPPAAEDEATASEDARAEQDARGESEAPPRPADEPIEVVAAPAAGPEPAPAPPAEPPPEAIDVSVFGDAREVSRVAGSAHRIDEEQLERFEDDNVHRVLMRVPGVYVRGEDGYGLRPNIGLRGASSDRSKKITLMEDGVLLAPAPYSAPAAYYFPLTTRMVGVEVFKGPSAIRYGPNTIGGAINMLSRRIPHGHKIGGDLAFGTELYGKGHGYYGYGDEHWGVLVEGVRIRSDGFKDLDAPPRYGESPNTGFDKIESMLKARVNTDPAGSIYNEGSVKLTFSREVSNETYLGLTDADFEATPFRRYAGSQLDRMGWHRFGVEVSHGLVVRDRVTVRTTLYRHDFHRAWRKLNGFRDGPALYDILADPTSRRAIYHSVLTGADSTDNEHLLVGINDRTFVSQGIQSSSRWELPRLGPVDQKVLFGVRLHNDSIDRLHTEDGYLMRSGALVRDTTPTAVTTENRGEALAFAAHAADEIALYGLMVSPGVRLEYIVTDFEDRQSGLATEGKQLVVLPGVAAIYQLVDWLSVLGGVHQGFSPVAPGQPDGVKPELAVNYELGSRLTTKHVGAELIGFFSDYSNLTGQCSFSSGCDETDVDSQFNAGKAHIYGLEASVSADIPTPIDLRFPLTASYTFTHAEFRSAFSSEDPSLADVVEGDRLPYVPTHQLAATASMVSERWGGLAVGATFVDEMREQAGQGDEGTRTDRYVVFDGSAYFNVLESLAVYFKVENLLDNHYIVARRPYGARPGRPRFFYAGVKVDIDR